MPKAKSKASGAAAPVAKIEGVPSGKIAMQYPTVQEQKETKSVSVAGCCYERDGNGRFIVMREHAPTLMQAGLIFSE